MKMNKNPMLITILMATLLPYTRNGLVRSGGGGSDLNPLVIIPGSGGNILEARLSADYKPSSLFCRLITTQKNKDGWFRLWFDPTVLLAPFTRCFAERMMLYYHEDIDDYRNAPGVETRAPDLGSTKGLLYLDPHIKQVLSLFLLEFCYSSINYPKLKTLDSMSEAHLRTDFTFIILNL